MAKIGAVRDKLSDDNTAIDFTGISYITDELRNILKQLPLFESITKWKKELKGILKDFTFMNLKLLEWRLWQFTTQHVVGMPVSCLPKWRVWYISVCFCVI